MSRYQNQKLILPSGSYQSHDDFIITKLEEIFESSSYSCFYKSRILQMALLAQNNQRQMRSDYRNHDLQEIYLRDSPKSKLQMCLSFEKYRNLTIKYFKVFAPSRSNLYSYDIFLELKDLSQNILNQLEELKGCLFKLIEFQKTCSFMPLRKIYLQTSTLISPDKIEQLNSATLNQIVHQYSSCRQQIQDKLFPLFQEINPLNFKHQFCFSLFIDESKTSEINKSNKSTSQIIFFILNLDQLLKHYFQNDLVTIYPQQFFELSFYQHNELIIKESLNSYQKQIAQICIYQKNCSEYQQYCPIRIYYDLFSE
ncbi:hypothetical protein ABPG72_006133 [Tetrahymena utriculariae]